MPTTAATQTMTPATDSQAVHIFELAGLGVGPFEFEGEFDRGARNHTTCDYCGTSIRYEEIIRDANGHTFKVGNECVMKTGDRGLTSRAEEAKKERMRQQRLEKQRQAIAKSAAEAEARENAERAKNGGLTNRELAEKQTKDAEAQRIAELGKANAKAIAEWDRVVTQSGQRHAQDMAQIGVPIDLARAIAGIKADTSGFVGSIWAQLHSKPLAQFSSRQAVVMCEAMARTYGRKGSKQYQAEYSRLLALFD